MVWEELQAFAYRLAPGVSSVSSAQGRWEAGVCLRNRYGPIISQTPGDLPVSGHGGLYLQPQDVGGSQDLHMTPWVRRLVCKPEEGFRRPEPIYQLRVVTHICNSSTRDRVLGTHRPDQPKHQTSGLMKDRVSKTRVGPGDTSVVKNTDRLSQHHSSQQPVTNALFGQCVHAGRTPTHKIHVSNFLIKNKTNVMNH